MGLPNPKLYVQTSGGRHIHKCIEAEPIDPAAQQVVEARARDAEARDCLHSRHTPHQLADFRYQLKIARPGNLIAIEIDPGRRTWSILAEYPAPEQAGKRLEALQELSRLSQELGLGY